MEKRGILVEAALIQYYDKEHSSPSEKNIYQNLLSKDFEVFCDTYDRQLCEFSPFSSW